MEGGLFLDVVVLESATVLELLSSEDESLLVWGNTFFILDLGLDGFDGVGLLNFESNSFTGEGLDENLHFSSWLLLFVIIIIITKALLIYSSKVHKY